MRAALALVLAGCGAAGGSDAAVADLAMPAPDLELCDPGQLGDGGMAPSLANVQRVFDFACVGCHCCSDPLTLASGASWAALVNRPAPRSDARTDESCGGLLVKPGDPAASYLYQKIASATPCAGQPMPLNEFQFVPLPACAQDLVRRWIASGAPNN